MIEPQLGDRNRKVLYKTHHGEIEEGVLVSWNTSYVFVRFGNDVAPKACNPVDVEWICS